MPNIPAARSVAGGCDAPAALTLGDMSADDRELVMNLLAKSPHFDVSPASPDGDVVVCAALRSGHGAQLAHELVRAYGRHGQGHAAPGRGADAKHAALRDTALHRAAPAALPCEGELRSVKWCVKTCEEVFAAHCRALTEAGTGPAAAELESLYSFAYQHFTRRLGLEPLVQATVADLVLNTQRYFHLAPLCELASLFLNEDTLKPVDLRFFSVARSHAVALCTQGVRTVIASDGKKHAVPLQLLPLASVSTLLRRVFRGHPHAAAMRERTAAWLEAERTAASASGKLVSRVFPKQGNVDCYEMLRFLLTIYGEAPPQPPQKPKQPQKQPQQRQQQEPPQPQPQPQPYQQAKKQQQPQPQFQQQFEQQELQFQQQQREKQRQPRRQLTPPSEADAAPAAPLTTQTPAQPEASLRAGAAPSSQRNTGARAAAVATHSARPASAAPAVALRAPHGGAEDADASRASSSFTPVVVRDDSAPNDTPRNDFAFEDEFDWAAAALSRSANTGPAADVARRSAEPKTEEKRPRASVGFAPLEDSLDWGKQQRQAKALSPSRSPPQPQRTDSQAQSLPLPLQPQSMSYAAPAVTPLASLPPNTLRAGPSRSSVVSVVSPAGPDSCTNYDFSKAEVRISRPLSPPLARAAPAGASAQPAQRRPLSPPPPQTPSAASCGGDAEAATPCVGLPFTCRSTPRESKRLSPTRSIFSDNTPAAAHEEETTRLPPPSSPTADERAASERARPPPPPPPQPGFPPAATCLSRPSPTRSAASPLPAGVADEAEAVSPAGVAAADVAYPTHEELLHHDLGRLEEELTHLKDLQTQLHRCSFKDTSTIFSSPSPAASSVRRPRATEGLSPMPSTAGVPAAVAAAAATPAAAAAAHDASEEEIVVSEASASPPQPPPSLSAPPSPEVSAAAAAAAAVSAAKRAMYCLSPGAYEASPQLRVEVEREVTAVDGVQETDSVPAALLGEGGLCRSIDGLGDEEEEVEEVEEFEEVEDYSDGDVSNAESFQRELEAALQSGKEERDAEFEPLPSVGAVSMASAWRSTSGISIA